MDIKEIHEVFERQLKLDLPDLRETYLKAYLDCIYNALDTGMLKMPQNKKELIEEARDVSKHLFKYLDLSGFFSLSRENLRFNELIGKFELSYNVKDVLSSDNEIQNLSTKILKECTNHTSKSITKWKELNQLQINLTLKKDGSLYKIDEYFSKLLTEIQKQKNIKVDITINFGEGIINKNDIRYLLDGNQIKNLSKLQQTLHKICKGNLYFNEVAESDTRWTLDDVIKANTCINDLAKTITDNNLSPFEALLFVCTWAQKNINYHETDDFEKTNTIVAGINNLRITCVGFSQFVNAVIKRISPNFLSDDNFIMSDGTINVSYGKSNIMNKEIFVSNHSQGKYYIADTKYNIDGEVIADVLGFPNYGIDMRNLGNIALLSMRPITTVSQLKKYNELYKIFSGNIEQSSISNRFFNIFIDGKTQSKILKETRRNEKISLGLEQQEIDWNLYTEAYKKIIPLVFPEAQTGDVIAPKVLFFDKEKTKYEYDKTICISDNETKTFWRKEINKNYSPENRENNQDDKEFTL